MALIHKNGKVDTESETKGTPTFTRDEIIWLMTLIKDGTFKGADVQTVYEVVVKLQHMANK